jgi:sialic acid synthase SpsE
MNMDLHSKALHRPWETNSEAGPLIIAEIGTGHGGDIGRARELIDAAAKSGAGCVKFQHVYADEIIHPLTGMVPLPGGMTPLYQAFRALERPIEFMAELKSCAEAHSLAFLCTPFGSRSLSELVSLDVAALKVASPELNHLQLLDGIAATGLPVFLSTGVSRLSDIEEAVEHLDGNRTALFHCVTSYPAPEEEYNLRLLPSLQSLFGLPVGVSDHSIDPLLVPLAALAQGASSLEKHFTLDRRDGGLDDPVALAPAEFLRMTQALSGAAGSDPRKILADLEEEYGAERLAGVLGNGKKQLAPSEAGNYGKTNRSIHALKEIPAGAPIEVSQLAVLRTEKVLRPGLHPRYLNLLDGRRAAVRIPAGEGIRWSDIL